MWPILLDMTKEESMQHLRCLEIDAFSGLVNALRAQGTLNTEKLNLLRETSSILHISQERHKAEIRRVVNDERLNTIAYHVNGERHCGEEWADEGQRLIPLMPRVAPQTAYSAIADEVADATSKLNKQLPLPASTERKRMAVSPPTHSIASSSGSVPQNLFRGVETERKRKHSMNMENCVLAQHLMAPPKISKIQQIYRQRSKSRLKEQLVKLKPPEHHETLPQQQQQVLQMSGLHKTFPTPKINILQNHTLSTSSPLHHRSIPLSEKHDKRAHLEGKVPCKNETRVGPDEFPDVKPTQNHISRPITQTTAPSVSITSDKTPSVATPATSTSKTITTTDGQKLIVVSTHANHTLTPTPSILQRTLTTIPFKSLAVNPKFRIVPKATSVVSIASNCTTSNTITTLSNNLCNVTPKMVRMRNTANKMIPLSNVQVLNTKTGFKVLPLSGKKSKITPKEQPKHLNNCLDGEDTIKDSITDLTIEDNHLDERFSPDACITIEDDSNYQELEKHDGNVEIFENCREVNGVERTSVTNVEDVDDDSHLRSEITMQPVDLTAISDENIIGTHAQDNGVDHSVEAKVGELFQDEIIEGTGNEVNHVEDGFTTMDIIEDAEMQEQTIQEHPIRDVPLQETEVFEEKVDLDSSVYIYGDNDNESEEVIIDGMGDQPMEVLNAVHALDGSFPNTKNVRS